MSYDFRQRQHEDRPHPLPPTKATCLSSLARAPVSGVWNGPWASSATGHVWNTHTIAWLVSKGWATFNPDRTEATITRAGRQYELTMEVSP